MHPTTDFTAAGESNFIVKAYDQNLALLDLLVNEIGAYTGSKIIPNDTAYLIIQANAPWTIQISSE